MFMKIHRLSLTSIFIEQGAINHKNDLLLCLLSRESSKGAIATVAGALARAQRCRTQKHLRSSKSNAYRLSVEELDHTLEGAILML